MPEVPVIQEFAKTPANDFCMFQWTWGNQTNLTIQAKGVRNPRDAIIYGGNYQPWPSFNGTATSPQALVKAIESTPVKFDNVELILNHGGKKSTEGTSHAMEFARTLGGETGVMSYSYNGMQFPKALRQALSDLPDAITGDAAALGKLAAIPGWGTPSVTANGKCHVTRIKAGKQLRTSAGTSSNVQPYHVRAGKRPIRPEEVVGSLPKSARMDAASGARGGRVTIGEMAEDAIEGLGVL